MRTCFRRSIYIMVGFLSAICAHGVSADEGLFIGNHPRSLNSCWNATVNVGAGGSGVIVHVEPGDDAIDVYVLTAEHVVPERRDGSVSPIFLEYRGEMVAGEYVESTKMLSRNPLSYTRDGSSDLAVAKVRILRDRHAEYKRDSWHPDDIAKDIGFDRLKAELTERMPLPKVASCDRVTPGAREFAVGYSETYFRKHPRIPVAEKNTRQKRWSQGNILNGDNNVADLRRWVQDGRKRGQNLNIKNFQSISSDAIHGNSGGPICNNQGEIIGVYNGGLKYADAEYDYLGREIAASCESVQALLDRAIPAKPQVTFDSNSAMAIGND